MALVIVMLSGVAGGIAALVALIFYNVSLMQALALYLVSSIVPVALVMAGVFLYIQITRAMATHDRHAEVHRAHR
ncbi:hypothetical protein [Marimonas arenosa]|uniref:Uncharacterized protein n=1 Tax=Marimonas arenosa TaxID=1795305 RepID=A0AAE3WG29_9RHOB|nr:hypothetical protein [Marimonas arenosa]MDQ2091030.1 hypothetical protein [Marimonas arenosa]